MMRRKKSRHLNNLYGHRRKSTSTVAAAAAATATATTRTVRSASERQSSRRRGAQAADRIVARAEAAAAMNDRDVRHERRQHYESLLRNGRTTASAPELPMDDDDAHMAARLQREELLLEDDPTNHNSDSQIIQPRRNLRFLQQALQREEELLREHSDHAWMESSSSSPMQVVVSSSSSTEDEEESNEEDNVNQHREWIADLQRLQEQNTSNSNNTMLAAVAPALTPPIVYTDSDDEDEKPYFQDFPQDDSILAAALQHEECLLQVDHFISVMGGRESASSTTTTLHVVSDENDNNIQNDAALAAALQQQEYDLANQHREQVAAAATRQRSQEPTTTPALSQFIHRFRDSNRSSPSDDATIHPETEDSDNAPRRGRPSRRVNSNRRTATTANNDEAFIFCTKVEELQMGLDSFSKEVNLSTKASIAPNMHALVQNLLRLQKEFQSHGKPSQVDIGYYCHHGNGPYGHGVYTSTEPCVSKNEKGMIVARLQGTSVTVAAGTTLWEDNVDTKMGTNVVVLSQSSQCVPLMGFSPSMLATSQTILSSAHDALSKLVDQAFKKQSGRRQRNSNIPATILAPSSMLPDFFPVLHSTLEAQVEEKDELPYRELTVLSSSYDCAICLDPMCAPPPPPVVPVARKQQPRHKKVVCLKGCGHEFHLKCIHQVMKHKFSDCPLCKQPVLKQDNKQKPTLRMRAHCYTHKSTLSSGAILLEYEVRWSHDKKIKTQTGCLPNTEPGWMLLRRLHHGFLSKMTFMEDGSDFIRWEPIHRKISLTTCRLWDDLFFHRCNEDLDRLGIPPSEECEAHHWNQIISHSNQDEGMEFFISSFVPNAADIRVMENSRTASSRRGRFQTRWQRRNSANAGGGLRDINPETLLKHMTKKDPSLNQLSRSLLQYASDRKKRLSCEAQLRQRLKNRVKREEDSANSHSAASHARLRRSQSPSSARNSPPNENDNETLSFSDEEGNTPAVTLLEPHPIVFQEPLQIRQMFARAPSTDGSSSSVYQEPLQVCQSFARATTTTTAAAAPEDEQVARSGSQKNESNGILNRSKRERAQNNRRKTSTEESSDRSQSTREISSRLLKREKTAAAKRAPRRRSEDERPKRSEINKELKRLKQDETAAATTTIDLQQRGNNVLQVEQDDSKPPARPVRRSTTTNKTSRGSDTKKRSPSRRRI